MHAETSRPASPLRHAARLRRWRSPAYLPVAATLFALFFLAVRPLRADSRWTVRSQASLWTAIDARAEVTAAGEEPAIQSVSDGASFGLAVEFLVRPKLGLELGFLVGGLDTDLTFNDAGGRLADSDRFDLYATTLGVNYHLAQTPRKRAGVHLGAFVQQSNYSDVTFLNRAGSRRTLAFDDDYGAGVKIGVDLPFKAEGRWLFNADLRYVATILETEAGGQDLELDPLVISIGLGYRF